MDAIDAEIQQEFPSVVRGGFQRWSDETDEYNCIAFAAGDFTQWWWPVGKKWTTRLRSARDAYWPPSCPREVTIQAFICASATLGYSPCADGTVETGYEKVALYVDAGKVPTHAARQTPSGKWASKLGDSWDIEHTQHLSEYGSVEQFLKRPIS